MSVATGASALTLPVRPKRPEDRGLRKFEPAETAPDLDATVIRKGSKYFRTVHDHVDGRLAQERMNDDGLVRVNATGWSYGQSVKRAYSIKPSDPLSAEAALNWRKEFLREGFHVKIEADTSMRAFKDHFLLLAKLDAYEGHARVFSREWSLILPRTGV